MKKLLFFLLASMLARGIYVASKATHPSPRINAPIINVQPNIPHPPAVKKYPGRQYEA